MNAAIVVLAALIVGTHQWKLLEDRADEIMPLILKTYPLRADLNNRLNVQRRKDLGAYDPTAIPMYLKYLRDNPVAPHNWVVVGLSERIGGHSRLFLPFAVKYLAEPRCLSSALAFVRTHGRPAEAEAVAALLLGDDFQNENPRSVLSCLRKIGGRDVLAALQQYALRQIARDPDGLWIEDANQCRRAIELRLEAEEKGLVHTPYRYAPDPWRSK